MEKNCYCEITLTGRTVQLEPRKRVRRRKKIELSGNQTLLLSGKTLWQKEQEQTLKKQIADLKQEIERIEHIFECRDCMLMIVMAIERYGGRNLPWYLNLTQGFEFSDDCPKPEDYEIGYYGKDNLPGTRKFILDRLSWALKTIRKTLQDSEKELKELSNKKAW